MDDVEEVEQMIALCHTGFLICTGTAILSLALAGFLCFRFRIPALLGARTGRNRRKSIREIEDHNACPDEREIRPPSPQTGSRPERESGTDRLLPPEEKRETDRLSFRFVLEKDIVLTHTGESLEEREEGDREVEE